MNDINSTNPNKLAVFYNGACPICAREIAFYRKRKGADGISWVDVSRFATEDEVAPGVSKKEVHVRFHVLYADGMLVSGTEAFAGLWLALPGFRLWGRFFEVLTSTRPNDVRLSRVARRESDIVESNRAGFEARRERLVKGIARLRPRAVWKPSHDMVDPMSEGGAEQVGPLASS